MASGAIHVDSVNMADANQNRGIESSSAQAGPTRLAWVDLIRSGGAFLVVLAHVILYPSMRGAGPLWAQSVYYTATRVAVPLFFMASGYLLLGRDEAYGDFFRKRALRVFIPFVLWSFVYIAWNGGFEGKQFDLPTLGEALLRILRGPRAAHLWFFYVLISLYLITPILRIFANHATNRDLLYFCSLWLLLDPILSLIRRLTGVQVGFEFLFLTGYIGYYVLGFYLGRLAETRALTAAALLVLVVSFAFVFTTVYFGQQAKGYDQFFEGYLSISVVLMTAASFVVIRAMNGSLDARRMRWIVPLSHASLGIYLVHVIALDVMDAYLAPQLALLRTASSILAMPAVALAAFLVCFLVVWLVQKVPVLRYAVP